jgi:hypothetical protein
MSDLDIAKQIYKNETEFLKKFIYDTQDETFMTIFDSERRERCKKCKCCNESNHRIKISQLYNLVKGCIIYQKKLLNHEINNLDIFQIKNNLICNCCDFKTIYECIIEDLFFDKVNTIENTEKKSITDKEYNHYKYIGNLRDHILNNFQTNLFPIFNKQLFPDFVNTHFNPDLYFFDYEITIIIDNINKENYLTYKKTINTILNKSYFNKYSDIRSEISHDDLKCIILSYRDILIDWYEIINKRKQISDNMFYDKLLHHLWKIGGICLLVVIIIMKYMTGDNNDIVKNIGDAILLIVVYFHGIVKANEEPNQTKLIVDLDTRMRQKEFIYKDITWDDHTGLTSRKKYIQELPELEKSKLYIQDEIPKYESQKNYDLNNFCRYAHYLSYKLNILNTEIHTSIETAQKNPVSPIIIKEKYSERLKNKKKLDSLTEVSLRNTLKKREVSLRNTFKKRIRRICKSKKLRRKK